MKKFYLFKTVVLFSVGTTLIAQPYTPKGNVFSQPQEIEKLLPAISPTIKTPGLNSERASFTSQEEMMNYLEEMSKKSKNMQIEIIGYSQEKREIPAIIFAKNKKMDPQKPTVWIQGQQHGNEPAGGEGVLATIGQLVDGKLENELLDKINIILIPRANPDGSWLFIRGTSSPQDINRDHTKLNLPETLALKKLYSKYQPEVIIDSHEYTGTPTGNYKSLGNKGVVPFYDVLMLPSTNANLSPAVTKLADDILIKNGEHNLEKKGITSTWYYGSTTPKKQDAPFSITMAGGDAIIGRNAFGLVPSISILVETKGIGIGRDNFSRRVESHLIIHESFLRDTAKNASLIKETIKKAREEVALKGGNIQDHETDKIIIQSKPIEEGITNFKFIDLESNTVKEFPVKVSTTKKQEVILERSRPFAYIIPPGYSGAATILENHGVKVIRTDKPLKLKVEGYEIKNIKIDDKFYEGQYRTFVQTETAEKEIEFPSGSYIYRMDQSMGDFIALSLEPESTSSFTTYNILPITGNKIPVYRMMENFDK